MRAFAAPSAIFCLLACGASVSAQEFPYTVTLAAGAPLRAAASETNEPTATLAAGSKLEVYRHEGNFLAVRPPEGSFSWVRASDVQPTGDANIVRVAASAAQAWVGHAGSELRSISQVQLQPGEKLRVLAAVASASDPAQASWYQISPPAGEFRYLLAQHAVGDAAVTEAAALPVAVVSAPLAQASSLNLQEQLPLAASDPVAERLKQIDAQLAAMLAQSPSTWNTAPLYTELQTLTASAPTADLRTQAQNLWWRVAKCQQVQQGYVQIGTTPTAVASPWALASAQTATTTTQPLAAIAPANFSATSNTQANQPLVNRLREIAGSLNANMQQQRTYTSSLRSRQATSSQPAAAAAPTSSTVAPAVDEVPDADPEAAAGGYAGTGWLMPLVNRSQLSREGRSGVPPYALTDDAGNVKFLVTPSPGLSVSEYARKKVGVIGPVGQLPNLTNPHLTAQRVVILERHE